MIPLPDVVNEKETHIMEYVDNCKSTLKQVEPVNRLITQLVNHQGSYRCILKRVVTTELTIWECCRAPLFLPADENEDGTFECIYAIEPLPHELKEKAHNVHMVTSDVKEQVCDYLNRKCHN